MNSLTVIEWRECSLMLLTLCFIYLPRSTLTTDHQRLVDWMQLTTNVPVGFLGHNEDVWLELLFQDKNR